MSTSPTTQNLTRASLRRNRTPHTVLLRMAQDEARAERIRHWKQDHPELTWSAIAEKIGVTERSAIEWQATGAISYENAKKLAKLMAADVDWLWRGDKGATPDLPAALNGTQLDRIEERLARIEAALELLTATNGKRRAKRATDKAVARSRQRRATAPADPPAQTGEGHA